MSSDHHDILIIGAGIVGLATALEAGRRFPRARLLVVDKEDRVAAHQTGHNSGVIHSGIYYRPGSVKARTCVAGRTALLAFCREQGIRHEVCGKVVVATREDELPALEELRRRGEANGVAGLSIVGPERLREIEPHSAGIRALHVPEAGITDYGEVARRFAALITGRGGEIRTSARVIGLTRSGGESVVETTAGTFTARQVVNCAGLYSDRVARLAGARFDVRIVPFRGEYCEIVPERRRLVRSLIYPVPDPRYPFLGVHVTCRVGGAVEVGPNAVLALGREGYRRRDLHIGEALGTILYPGLWRLAVRHWRSGLAELHRSFSRAAFLRSAQRLVPDLRAADLRPAGAGVRAQALDRHGVLVDDFHFALTDGVVHVLNVPSPAATAAIAIGRTIVDMLPRTE